MVGSPGGKEIGRLAVKILPDTSDFLPELKAFAERVESEIRIEIPVLLDRDSFREELDLLKAQVQLSDIELDVGIDIDGAGALAHLDTILAAMQGTASLNDIDVNVDLDTGGATAQLVAFTAASGTASSGTSFIGRQIALWGPLIFIAAVGIAALAPALAVVFPLIAGVALGVGAIALGFDQLKAVLAPIKAAFGDMRKEIGLVLTAGLGPLIATLVSDFIPVLQQGLTIFADLFNTAAKSLLGFLGSAEGLDLMSQLVVGLGEAFAPFAQLVGPFTEVFLRLSIAALPALQMMGDALLDITNRFADFLTGSDVSSVITDSMQELGDVLVIIGTLIADLFPPLLAAAPGVIALLAGIGAVIGTVFAVLQPLFEFMSEHTTTMQIIGAALAGVAIALGLVAAGAFLMGVIFASTATIIAAVIGAVIGALIYAYTEFATFRNIVNAVIGFVVGLFTRLWTAAVAVFNGVVSAIRFGIGMFVAFHVAVGNAVTTAVSWVTGLPGRIKSGLGSLLGLLESAGRDLIRGLMNGIGDMVGALYGKIRSVASGAVSAAKGIFGIDSPSTVFRSIGEYVMEGLTNGLEAGFPEVVSVFDQLNSMVDDFSSITPTVDFSTSGFGSSTRAFDMAFSGAGADGPTEIVMRNWDTGLGTMQKISAEQAAQTEALNSIDDILGA